MNKLILRTIMIIALCGAVFGADSKMSGSDAGKPPALDPIPENVTLSMEGRDYMDFVVNTPVKDYLTEQFVSINDAFDLIYHSVTFIPTSDGTSYTVEVQQISQLPTNPAKGFDLELSDDASRFVELSDSATVSIYGIGFTGFYVGSNGYVTFTEGDEEYSESLQGHFDTLRVSALFHDLDPSEAGQVTFIELTDRAVVTWENVPVHNTSNSNTFQIELFFDGNIRLSWLDIGAEIGIVGLSDGLGVPQDFQEADFSDLSPPSIDDYLTEQFDSADDDDFDLSYASVTFYPTPDGASYIGIMEDISQLPTDPFGGTDLKLRDDNYVLVGLSNEARVRIFNQSFSTFFVGSNGYITFTQPDNDHSETLAKHFETLRISGLYTDLTAAYTGIVTGIQFVDRVAITWQDVPEFENTSGNTFQIEMFYDGRIRISWLDIGSQSNIVGLSNGLGLPDDFKETDFSELSTPSTTDDYLTEQFTSVDDDDFDLSYASVTFFPSPDRTSYTGVMEDISELPTNPFGGTDLKLRDDNYVLVGLSDNAEVVIFNQSFPTFFVGSNGYITFTRPDNDHSETMAEHFDTLRISGLYTDLTAAYTGIVSGIQFVDRVAITWEGVPEFSHTGENTFQIEMFYDGRIRISWLEIPSPSNIVGLSNGLGLSPDFVETDFSVDYAPKP